MAAANDGLAERIRHARASAGLSQAALAERAGVSRAAVGALEQGRHMPAADAALRLARALGTTVERLLEPPRSTPLDPAATALGDPLPDGALVRAARVGETLVARALDGASALGAAGAAADGVVEHGRIRRFAGVEPRGAVIAGCDPLLAIAEGHLEAGGAARVVGVPATTGQALRALAAGRCHGALVHGPAGELAPPEGVERWHVARWRSGLATHPRLARPGRDALLAGEIPTIGREPSAACQQAVERAARRLGLVPPKPGRIAAGHLDAARAALEHEGAAVTIEPVALATGLDFLPLEEHAIELWVPGRWVAAPGVEALLDLLASRRFQERAGALPAYDLADAGVAR